MKKARWGPSQTSASIHLPNESTFPPFNPLTLITQVAGRERYALMMRLSVPTRAQSGTRCLGRRSSTNKRVGKAKSSKKGMRSEAAAGLASNILCDGKSLGWMVLVLLPQNFCRIGGRQRCHRNRSAKSRQFYSLIVVLQV